MSRSGQYFLTVFSSLLIGIVFVIGFVSNYSLPTNLTGDKVEVLGMSDNAHQTQEVGIYTNRYQITNEILPCLKSELTEYEYQRLRKLNPKVRADYEEIDRLRNKSESCFNR